VANLDIQHLSKSFGKTRAVQDVSLSITDGEFLILLGPTGAGKTTTLRCVAGLEKPDAGIVNMNGQSINGLTPAERDVAFVFQSYALYPRKTVYENMAFPLEARKLSKNDIDTRIREIARKLSIDTLLDRRPAQLSGGQQQRVALGRAMVRQPRLFLMDEPLTNLDFKLRVEMRAELKRLQSELSATFFYVTNDQVEAMSMADRIAVLNHGILQQIDTPENVYDKPANLFVAGFVGSPRMNFLDCRFSDGALVGTDGAWQMALNPTQREQIGKHLNGGEGIFGIRPEDVDLSRSLETGTIPAEVYVVEPLGDRTIVDMHIGSATVKVKAAPDFDVGSGTSLNMRFDPGRFHVFEKSTGKTII
jgi:multiple sugar transport system ATP-binding protein